MIPGSRSGLTELEVRVLDLQGARKPQQSSYFFLYGDSRKSKPASLLSMSFREETDLRLRTGQVQTSEAEILGT